MCNFHRCVHRSLFDMWEELVNLVGAIERLDGEDELYMTIPVK
jgi:hypothetical protein